MPNLPVIHFTKLSDLLDELGGRGRQPVRVATMQRRENKNGHFPYSLYTISVDVRALHNGAILSYRAMQEEIRSDMTSDRAQINQKYDQAWKEAGSVRVAIATAINNAGHDPRPGIIDLQGVEPVLGEQWPLSERES